MIKIFDPLEHYQKKLLKFSKSSKCPELLKSFYQRPIPRSKDLLKDLKVISFDFETTGIDVNKDFVLSIGGISIVNGAIDFGTAFHYFVNNGKFVKKDSAIINQITPEQLQGGKDPIMAILELLDKVAGNVVLVHCKFIETNFIKNTLKLPKNAPLPFVVLDTMSIERTLIRQKNIDDVRLTSIRERRKLPAYDGHNALVDSLATAEVLLSQTKDIFGKVKANLGILYKRSR